MDCLRWYRPPRPIEGMPFNPALMAEVWVFLSGRPLLHRNFASIHLRPHFGVVFRSMWIGENVVGAGPRDRLRSAVLEARHRRAEPCTGTMTRTRGGTSRRMRLTAAVQEIGELKNHLRHLAPRRHRRRQGARCRISSNAAACRARVFPHHPGQVDPLRHPPGPTQGLHGRVPSRPLSSP